MGIITISGELFLSMRVFFPQFQRVVTLPAENPVLGRVRTSVILRLRFLHIFQRAFLHICTEPLICRDDWMARGDRRIRPDSVRTVGSLKEEEVYINKPWFICRTDGGEIALFEKDVQFFFWLDVATERDRERDKDGERNVDGEDWDNSELILSCRMIDQMKSQMWFQSKENVVIFTSYWISPK